MAQLELIDLVGFWLGIFLTFCILSFLYKDNPLYKFAEHLFIGVSIGYIVTKQFFDVLSPKLVDNLVDGHLWYLGGLLLSILLLLKLSKRFGWLGRFPIAFVVAFYAGLQINGVAQADLGAQTEAAMGSVVARKVDINWAARFHEPIPLLDAESSRKLIDQHQIARLGQLPGMSPLVAARVVERSHDRLFEDLGELETLEGLGELQVEDLQAARGSISGLDARAQVTEDASAYAFGTLSQLLLLLGLLCGLVYFYFSVAQKGTVGKISRIGVWVLMIGFGASFGYTVQGRLSLAIGRALDVLGRDKDPRMAEQIQGGIVAVISIVLIVIGIVAWEIAQRRKREVE